MYIELVEPKQAASVELGLADVLVDSVAGGACVGFLDPLSHEHARAWWHDALREPNSKTWIAHHDGWIVGTVRLLLATAPNGRHRAEVTKLLVHSAVRGRGYARALMEAVEDGARRLGRKLLVLDAQSGSLAEQLYEKWGWRPVGVVEDYALTPDGRLASTTFMTKRL